MRKNILFAFLFLRAAIASIAQKNYQVQSPNRDGPKRSETVTFGFSKEPKARYVNPSGIYRATPPGWRFIFSATPLN